MKILFVASEAVPFCKTGGLADVVGSLAQRLGAAGHDVCLFLPRYRDVRAPQLDEGSARPLTVRLGSEEHRVGLRFLHRRAVTTYLVESPRHFDRDGLYGAGGRDHEDNDKRFGLLCAAALEGAKAAGFQPDVVHAHDWQAGPAAARLRAPSKDPFFARTGVVFTVHNMAYQGNFPRASLPLAGLGEEDFGADGAEFYGKVSYLKAGLAYADRVTTVSPTYAREIQESPDRGFGFEGLLRRRSGALRGILNGIDLEVWDPERDAAIARRFGPGGLAEGKAECKAALQRECGLREDADAALIGIVSRLDYMKGLDLALPAIEARLDRAQLVALGTGDPALTEKLAALERRHPGRVHFHRSFDEPFSHRVYAGSEIFMMPSRFEPCGLGQMIAMRYGAVPVAARTGGLADTVFETASESRPANGFLCEPGDGDGLAAALDRALAERASGRLADRARAGMARDFSWDRSMEGYLEVYREAAAARAGAPA